MVLYRNLIFTQNINMGELQAIIVLPSHKISRWWAAYNKHRHISNVYISPKHLKLQNGGFLRAHINLMLQNIVNVDHRILTFDCQRKITQFSLPQIQHPQGGRSKKGSHVYFLLQFFWVILLFDINVVLMLPWWPVTIVQSDLTIVVPWQLSTGSKHDYLFCYCPLVGILFEVVRILQSHANNTFCLHCSWVFP